MRVAFVGGRFVETHWSPIYDTVKKDPRLIKKRPAAVAAAATGAVVEAVLAMTEVDPAMTVTLAHFDMASANLQIEKQVGLIQRTLHNKNTCAGCACWWLTVIP